MERSSTFGPSLDNDDTTSTATSAVHENGSSTPGSPAQDKRESSNDRSNDSRAPSPMPLVFEMSAPASTTNDEDCEPFWNEFLTEISSKLSLPTKTGFADSGSTSSSGWSPIEVGPSWFSTRRRDLPSLNGFRISWRSSTSSALDSTDSEVTKTRFVKLYPTKDQKKVLRQWTDAARWFHNETLDVLWSSFRWGDPSDRQRIPSAIETRNMLWAFWKEDFRHVPQKICAEAILHAHATFWGQVRGKRKGPRFQSRHAPEHSCVVHKDAFKRGANGEQYILKKYTKTPFRTSEPLGEPAMADLIWRYGEWYLAMPYKTNRVPYGGTAHDVVAVDPGVRTFATFFSTRECGKLGEHDIGRIYRLCFFLDDLYSRASSAGEQRKRRMLRAASRIRKKIKNLVAELHKKTAHYLTSSYRAILLPVFATRDMVRKATRRIRSKTARAMMTWSHYQFKVRLRAKALERGCEVIEVSEAYTSKTMPDGSLRDLGGRESFEWEGHRIDRDLHGARNILLRALVAPPRTCPAVDNS